MYLHAHKGLQIPYFMRESLRGVLGAKFELSGGCLAVKQQSHGHGWCTQV